ncbi:response regulator transcription factor [Rhizobium mesosinicum]|uniref:Response regulator transcription factor n=1 Tax=Rhizobium mesosinicum TaxID=335017 RepID=A0ABS7GXB9_9HYPH|nr:response regulator [Rhizobium mesosinicum]MBW9054525.1 response regulator transcription factor [Rhizobium mesosinicum]
MTKASHPSMSSRTVHVIDDDARIRTSLVDFFASVGTKATAYASASDFMEQADLSEPGCVLLDVRMPGMTGLELQEKLSAAGCPLPIIFITGDACVEASVSAMKAGAFDFLLKPLKLETLAELTALALSRNAEMRAKYLARFHAQTVVDTLTPRESEVFALVSKGLPNKAIAREMNISEIMVKLHRSRMMKKLQARSVVDVVRTFDDLNTAKAN